MGKEKDDEEENAYESLDDWQAEDTNALKSSIQQHAQLIGGGDDTLLDEDDLQPIPVKSGGGSSHHIRTWQDEPETTSSIPHRNNLQPVLRTGKKSHSATDDKSVTSGHPSRVSFSPDVALRSQFKTNAQVASGTKLRALIALLCLVASLLLALFFGGGKTGRTITNMLIAITPGTSSVKEESPTMIGIPPAQGNTPTYNATFELPDLEGLNIMLTPEMENMADWRIPFPAANRTDLPVFWLIPKAGGQVVERILGQCMGLIVVSGQGVNNVEQTLKLFETPTGIRYLNVDSTTVAGLQRAKDLQLAKSGLADVMITNLIPQAAAIFNPINRGRLFTIFRHPLQRAMNVYNSAKIADPDVLEMSIADYAANYLPNNEMVRTLTGKGGDAMLTDSDLYMAMEILRRKCVVGLVDRMTESMTRFYLYFGWSSLLMEGVTTCQNNLLAPGLGLLPTPAEGTDAYNFMLAQNRLDMRLYEYVQSLYDLQGGKT